MKEIVKILGIKGRMISGSKSGYRRRFPDNFPVFNANICTKESGKIWYGDLDIVTDFDVLVKCAKEVKEDLYILSEMDARFENEKSPLMDGYYAIFALDGNVELNPLNEKYDAFKKLAKFINKKTKG